MRRLSVPVGETLYRDYDKLVPHGLKAALLRGLVRIAMNTPSKTLWDIAANESRPEMFEIRGKE